MAAPIPNALVEEIRQSTDIVNIISEYVVLKKRGKNYVGLCPFHSEKTASFSVNPDAQMFYCFGCGVGGNVYTFLMHHDRIPFAEAVKTLAARAGITLPEEKPVTPLQKKREAALRRLYGINILAGKFFHAYLMRHATAKEARQYLKRRGIASEIGKDFQLGFAPDQWDALCSFLSKKGFREREMIEAGVAQESKKGAAIDRFRNRLMFPIQDLQGRVVGFGGRVLDGGEPKYLNSPETSLFQKGSILYGLHRALPQIRKKDFVVVVEGYTDVLTAHQYGIENTVASLGTAFTREQGQLLRRFTQNVVIAYDADAAGAAASLRGLQILADCGCAVRVATVPKGKDPDEFIRSSGADAFLELVERKSLSLVEYRLQKACSEYGTDSVSAKVAAANDVIPSLAKIENAVEREAYVELIAKRLGLSQEAIGAELDRLKARLQNTGINKDKIVKNRYTSERISRVSVPDLPRYHGPAHALVWGAVMNPEIAELIYSELGEGSFSEDYLREVLGAIKETVETGKEVSPAGLIDMVTLEASRRFLSELYFREFLPPCDSPETAEPYIRRIKLHNIEEQIESKRKELEEAQKQGDLRFERACLEAIDRLHRLKEENRL